MIFRSKCVFFCVLSSHGEMNQNNFDGGFVLHLNKKVRWVGHTGIDRYSNVRGGDEKIAFIKHTIISTLTGHKTHQIKTEQKD